MKKFQWIAGLSFVGILAIAGTSVALTSGSNPANAGSEALNFKPTASVSQTLAPTPITPPTSVASTDTPSSTPTAPTPTPPADPSTPSTLYNDGYGYGYGMMGRFGEPNGTPEHGSSGYGMMGGFGGPNGGGGFGMMGGGYNAASLGISLPNGQVTTSNQAMALAKAYTQKLNQGFAVDELHEFTDSYEVELKEAQTGAKAYEFMIAKNGGQIFAEMGPNVMWNTKYGHMNYGNNVTPTMSAKQATEAAQKFVNSMGTGFSVDKPENAPGYYEFMVMKDGKDYAELDVNGINGQVWYENWHGPILNTVKAE